MFFLAEQKSDKSEPTNSRKKPSHCHFTDILVDPMHQRRSNLFLSAHDIPHGILVFGFNVPHPNPSSGSTSFPKS